MIASGKPLALWRKGRGTLWHIGRVAIATVFVLLVWAVVILAAEFLRTAEIVQKGNWEDPQWTVNHTQVEYLEFLRQLSLAQIDENADLEPLRLAFDILYSRVETLHSGSIVEPLRAFPGFIAELEVISAFVDATVEIVDAPDSELRAALPDIAARGGAFRENLHRLNMVSLEHWSAERIERREATARTLLWLSLALAATFALLLALAGGVWLNYRGNLRRQRAVAEAHAVTRAAEATLR